MQWKQLLWLYVCYYYHLYASLVEFSDTCELFADVDVRIVALGERWLELLQLFLRERRPMTTSRRRLTRRCRVQHVTGSHRRRHYTTSGYSRGAVQQAANTFRLDPLERTFHSFTHRNTAQSHDNTECSHSEMQRPGKLKFSLKSRMISLLSHWIWTWWDTK